MLDLRTVIKKRIFDLFEILYYLKGPYLKCHDISGMIPPGCQSLNSFFFRVYVNRDLASRSSFSMAVKILLTCASS